MSEILSLDPAVLMALGLAAFVGTLLQRLAGQGFGMLTSPVMALLAPQFLPASILLTGLVIGLSGAAVDRQAIARAELAPGFVGRTLGAVIAVWIAGHIAQTGFFGPLIAGVVFLGIAMSVWGVRVSILPASLFCAGTLAGVMGTLTGVGAPPMALLYQHEEQRRSAAMQNTFFFFGMIVSIPALFFAGLVEWHHLAMAAFLSPLALLAVALSRRLSHRVARARIRPLALGLAGLAASLLLMRSLI